MSARSTVALFSLFLSLFLSLSLFSGRRLASRRLDSGNKYLGTKLWEQSSGNKLQDKLKDKLQGKLQGKIWRKGSESKLREQVRVAIRRTYWYGLGIRLRVNLPRY